MPITRVQADTELIERAGALLTLVGKDGTTVDGTNQALVGALRSGLDSLGIIPASFGTITDDDLSLVADSAVAQLLDVAELRLVGGINASFTDVDEKISMGEKKVSQNRAAIQARYTSLAQFCRERYGYGLGRLRAGGINLGANRAAGSSEM